jgi:hypothetical protein
MVSRSLTLSFPFNGLDLWVHPIEGGHFNFAQRGLYYFGLAQHKNLLTIKTLAIMLNCYNKLLIQNLDIKRLSFGINLNINSPMKDVEI